HLSVAIELHRNRFTFASHHCPAHTVVHSEKTSHPFPIDFQNFVARLQASFRRRRIGHDVTDRCRDVRFAHRITSRPYDRCKNKGEQQTEQRTGHRDDDFVQGRDRRESWPMRPCPSFHRTHPPRLPPP